MNRTKRTSGLLVLAAIAVTALAGVARAGSNEPAVGSGRGAPQTSVEGPPAPIKYKVLVQIYNNDHGETQGGTTVRVNGLWTGQYRGTPDGGEDGFEPLYKREDRVVAAFCNASEQGCKLLTREYRLRGGPSS